MNKIFPAIALAVLLLSGGGLAYSLQGSAPTAKSTTAPTTTTQKSSKPLFVSPAEWVSTVSHFVESVFEKKSSLRSGSATSPASVQSSPTPAPQASSKPSPTPRITASPSSQASPKPTPKASPAPSATPKATPAPKKTTTAPATCRRFTITHLDGSQSNRCYSDDDYSQLSRLAGQLSSAQTFYQFHLEGVARYQKLYDDSGSSLWLDARASSQANADQEQSKIGPLQLQMYTIENRGAN